MNAVGKTLIAFGSGLATGIIGSAVFVNYAIKHKKKTVLSLIVKGYDKHDEEPSDDDINVLDDEIVENIESIDAVSLEETSSIDDYKPPREGDGVEYTSISTAHIEYVDQEYDAPSEYDDVVLLYDIDDKVLTDEDGHEIISPETIYGDRDIFVQHVNEADRTNEPDIRIKNSKTRTIYTVRLMF